MTGDEKCGIEEAREAGNGPEPVKIDSGANSAVGLRVDGQMLIAARREAVAAVGAGVGVVDAEDDVALGPDDDGAAAVRAADAGMVASGALKTSELAPVEVSGEVVTMEQELMTAYRASALFHAWHPGSEVAAMQIQSHQQAQRHHYYLRRYQATLSGGEIPLVVQHLRPRLPGLGHHHCRVDLYRRPSYSQTKSPSVPDRRHELPHGHPLHRPILWSSRAGCPSTRPFLCANAPSSSYA